MNSDQTPSFPFLSGEVFDSLPESIRSYIRYLETIIQQQQVQIQQQQVRIQQLEVRVHELEARLSKNSSNSSKPPGSDGLKKKTKSLRGKFDKKSGAQQGHAGKGLAQISAPDLIVTHTLTNCHGCGLNLSHVDGTCAEKRQVFDIPQPKIEVTEHQALEKKCPCCGELNRGVFPDNIRGPIQYGEQVQALTAYFFNILYLLTAYAKSQVVFENSAEARFFVEFAVIFLQLANRVGIFGEALAEAIKGCPRLLPAHQENILQAIAV